MAAGSGLCWSHREPGTAESRPVGPQRQKRPRITMRAPRPPHLLSQEPLHGLRHPAEALPAKARQHGESLPQEPSSRTDGTSHTGLAILNLSKLGGLRTNNQYLEFGSQSSKPQLTGTQIFLLQDPADNHASWDPVEGTRQSLRSNCSTRPGS